MASNVLKRVNLVKNTTWIIQKEIPSNALLEVFGYANNNICYSSFEICLSANSFVVRNIINYYFVPINKELDFNLIYSLLFRIIF